MYEVLNPCEVCISSWWHSILPPYILPDQFTLPVRIIEGRVGKDDVILDGVYDLLLLEDFNKIKKMAEAGSLKGRPRQEKTKDPDKEELVK